MVEKEDYVVRIGPLLKELLDLQKTKVKDATYNVVEASDYNAGEIIAKKIKHLI